MLSTAKACLCKRNNDEQRHETRDGRRFSIRTCCRVKRILSRVNIIRNECNDATASTSRYLSAMSMLKEQRHAYQNLNWGVLRSSKLGVMKTSTCRTVLLVAAATSSIKAKILVTVRPVKYDIVRVLAAMSLAHSKRTQKNQSNSLPVDERDYLTQRKADDFVLVGD